MSGYNPPPSYRRLNGDFFYLHIRTLENIDYHITANPRGFYINNSNINFFDPTPHVQNGRVYSSLFDLLNDISLKFKKTF
jgi:protein TIF31